MNKETRIVVGAFVRKEPASAARTSTDGTVLMLHGNRIAEWISPDQISVTLAGWATNTTRSRINAIFVLANIRARVFQAENKQYITIEDETFPMGLTEKFVVNT